MKAAKMQKDQLTDMYGEREAEVVMSQILAWRAMHSQGRGLNSVMMKTLGDDIDTYTLREAEFSCNALVGFNFGDGHLHDRRMIEAVQKRCRFEPVRHGSEQCAPVVAAAVTVAPALRPEVVA